MRRWLKSVKGQICLLIIWDSSRILWIAKWMPKRSWESSAYTFLSWRWPARVCPGISCPDASSCRSTFRGKQLRQGLRSQQWCGLGPTQGICKAFYWKHGTSSTISWMCTGSDIPVSSGFSPVVEGREESVWGEALVLPKSGRHHYRRQRLGLGGSLGATSGPAALVKMAVIYAQIQENYWR